MSNTPTALEHTAAPLAAGLWVWSTRLHRPSGVDQDTWQTDCAVAPEHLSSLVALLTAIDWCRRIAPGTSEQQQALERLVDAGWRAAAEHAAGGCTPASASHVTVSLDGWLARIEPAGRDGVQRMGWLLQGLDPDTHEPSGDIIGCLSHAE